MPPVRPQPSTPVGGQLQGSASQEGRGASEAADVGPVHLAPSRSTDHTDDSLPNSPPSGPAPSARGLDAVHALQLLLGEFADLHPALSTLHGDTFGRRLGGYLGDVDRVTHGATGGRADGIGDEGEILVTELPGISAVQKACSHVLVEDS